MHGAQWHTTSIVALAGMVRARHCCHCTFKNNPDFFTIKTPKNPDIETKFKPANTSKINAQMLTNFALSTNMVP